MPHIDPMRRSASLPPSRIPEFPPLFRSLREGFKNRGIAIFPTGVGIRNEEQLLYTIERWGDHLSSQVLAPGKLLESLATLRRAEAEDWPGRAVKIGKALRLVLQSLTTRPRQLGGLASLIYLRRPMAEKTCIVGAAAGKYFTRWLPYVDAGMETVDALFGPSSQSLRDELRKSGIFDPTCCVICNDLPENEIDVEVCETCQGPLCDICLQKPTKSLQHHKGGLCLSQARIIAPED